MMLNILLLVMKINCCCLDKMRIQIKGEIIIIVILKKDVMKSDETG